MVEVTVASALLMGGILMASNYISSGQSSRKTRSVQSVYRFLAIQATQEITTAVALYPPLDPLKDSDKIYYSGCFDQKGSMVATGKYGRSYSLTISDNYNENSPTPSKNCDPINSKYEVQFFWKDPAKNEVTINILNLRPETDPGQLKFQRFNIFAK